MHIYVHMFTDMCMAVYWEICSIGIHVVLDVFEVYNTMFVLYDLYVTCLCYVIDVHGMCLCVMCA